MLKFIVAPSRSRAQLMSRCRGRTLNSLLRRRGRALRFKSRHEVARSVSSRAIEVARSVSSRTVEGAHSIYYSAAVEAANSIAPPPARPSSHRTVVRSASCAVEALKLHFNCAVVRSSFIAPSSAHASLRRHALNLHWPILIDACHPLGVEFFRPFYLTHVVRLASNFLPIASLTLLAMSIETC